MVFSLFVDCLMLIFVDCFFCLCDSFFYTCRLLFSVCWFFVFSAHCFFLFANYLFLFTCCCFSLPIFLFVINFFLCLSIVCPFFVSVYQLLVSTCYCTCILYVHWFFFQTFFCLPKQMYVWKLFKSWIFQFFWIGMLTQFRANPS